LLGCLSLVWFGVWIGGVGTSTASAQEPVLVWVEGGSLPTLQRILNAELLEIGFALRVEPPREGSTERVSRLFSHAESTGAVAVIELVSTDRGVELWLVDRVTGKAVVRPLDAVDLADELAVRALALQIVELLRASLLELSVVGFEREAEAPPAARRLVEQAQVAPEPFRSALTLGGGVSWSPGGLEIAPQLFLSGRWFVHPRWRVGLDLMVPTFPTSLEGPEGVSTQALSLAAVAVDGSLPLGSRLTARFGGFIGAIWLITDGAPSSTEFRGSSSHAFSAVIGARFALAVAISSAISFEVDVSAGVSLPKISVAFDERVAASWGVPAILSSAHLEVRMGS